MNRILTYSFFLLFLFASCKSYQYPDAAGLRESAAKAVNNYYVDTTKTFVYRAKLEVFRKHVNGSLMVKNLPGKKHRIALISDFGQTLFDISLSADGYELHYAMPELNDRRTLREIVPIFRTMTEQRFATTALMFANRQHYYPVYVLDDCYYVLKGRRVERIIQVKGAKEYFTVLYSDWNEQQTPTKIQVAHHKLPLLIGLELDEVQSVI